MDTTQPVSYKNTRASYSKILTPALFQIMELSGESVGVYAEAKGEYTKQLCQFMLPALQQYFLDMLDDAKQKEPVATKVLLMFQQLLEGVPDWNVDKVQRETATLTAATHCDYLEELLTAVFIAHTKVLSAIRLTSRQKKLQITIPRLEHFLHRTFTECSRLLWSNIYLFSTTSPSIERQKNLRQIESILHDGIQQAIRGMLPVKNILREYLRDDEGEEEEEEAEEEKEEKETKEVKEVKEAKEDKEVKEVKEDKEDKEAKEEAKEDKEEAKEEAKEDKEAKEPKEEVKEEPVTIVVDASGVVATTTDTPLFTGIDTVFEDKTEEVPLSEFEPEETPDNEIQILDGSPEPMDDFEDLDNKDKKPVEPVKEEEELQMDFEELT